MLTQSPAELLEKDCGALGGSKEQQCVHFGEVHALVEDVYGEDDLEVAASERCDDVATLLARCVAGNTGGLESGFSELLGHELSVIDTHAEADGPHFLGVDHALGELLDDEGHPQLVAGVDRFEA